MSFYLDRLEAARRQHRMLAEGAAAGCAPPPRAWPPYFHYRHQYYQHAAALLPRSPTLPVPPLHAGEGGVVGHERGGGRRDTWRGGSVPRWEAESAVTAGVGAAWAGGNTVSAGGTGGLAGGSVPRWEAGPMSAGVGASCPPPKRRAVSARRRFPPGCGRDAAARLVGPVDGDSRSEPAHHSGGSGVLQESTTPPAPTTPLAAPSAPCSSQLLNKASAAADNAAGATTDGGDHCPGAALEKPSEAPGKNFVFFF